MNKKYEDMCWYHPKLTREDADDILLEEGNGKEGLFLVRDSSTSSGDYALSVYHDGQVNHFQIRKHAEDAFFSIDECRKFLGLEVLIEFYTVNPKILSEGLVLTEYVKGYPPPHDSRMQGHTNLLHRATSHGEYTVVSELLKTDYPYKAKNPEGQTAVHLASLAGKDDILRKLIQYEANVNLRDSFGYTPLHYACQNNYPTTVRLLVQLGGANIQARHTKTDAVPLHEAASRGHIEVVKELLNLKAPARPRKEHNVIPSELARKYNHIECAELLENYQYVVSSTDKNQWYHGTLDRQEAEAIIKQYSTKNGTFLIRFSERNKENVLTLINDNYFFNYIIRRKDNYYFIDDGPYLDSLEHIVEHYSYMPDGLPTILQIPVRPKPKPPVPEFSTMPKPKKKNHAKQLPREAPKPEDTYKFPNQFHNITFTSDITVSNNNNYTENIDEYIPLEQLKIGNLMGRGEFASVYEGTYIQNNGDPMQVAIKMLHSEQIDTNKDAFMREAEVMMKLNHHCVVRLIGLSDGPQLLMVQELVPLGSMLQYIHINKDNINAKYEFKIWAAQIACGMNYLERNGLIHRDLAARNILLASQIQAKISDFGLSRALGTDHEYYRASTGGKWPLKWYAPESFSYGQFSNKSDVWSFGVTLWEMYSFGEVPYGEMKGLEAMQLIERGERLKQPDGCPDHIYKIMRDCWEFDAVNRPSFEELENLFTSDTEYTNIQQLLPHSNLA